MQHITCGFTLEKKQALACPMATCSQKSGILETSICAFCSRINHCHGICIVTVALVKRPARLHCLCMPALGLVCLIRPGLGSPAAVAPLALVPPPFWLWNWSWNTTNASPTGFGCCCLLPVLSQPVSDTKHLIRRTCERQEAMSVGGCGMWGVRAGSSRALRRVGGFF